MHGGLGMLSTDSATLVGGHTVQGRGGLVFSNPGLVFPPRLLPPWGKGTRSSRVLGHLPGVCPACSVWRGFVGYNLVVVVSNRHLPSPPEGRVLRP